jgi:hypothetical protein
VEAYPYPSGFFVTPAPNNNSLILAFSHPHFLAENKIDIWLIRNCQKGLQFSGPNGNIVLILIISHISKIFNIPLHFAYSLPTMAHNEPRMDMALWGHISIINQSGLNLVVPAGK